MRWRVLLVALSLLAACMPMGSTDWHLTSRVPSGLPPSFARADSTAPTPAGACAVHLRDARDTTRLTLEQSTAGVGTYAVWPPNAYGVGENERLMLDCSTGRVLGIATRERGGIIIGPSSRPR
jgi:hypothetical protein